MIARVAMSLALIALCWTAPASASTILLGTGTYANANDLTSIQTADGRLWEWLDLTATAGLTVNDAVITFASGGFRWATGSEVASLYDAFGIGYSFLQGVRTDLAARADAMETFVNYLGFTHRDNPFLPTVSAYGWIDDHTSSTSHTYSCLSISGGCSPFSYVDNVERTFWPNSSHIGVYLVRDRSDTQTVPEPTTLALLSVALAAGGACQLVGARRKRP
jgi:hypothetical protein